MPLKTNKVSEISMEHNHRIITKTNNFVPKFYNDFSNKKIELKSTKSINSKIK